MADLAGMMEYLCTNEKKNATTTAVAGSERGWFGNNPDIESVNMISNYCAKHKGGDTSRVGKRKQRLLYP